MQTFSPLLNTYYLFSYVDLVMRIVDNDNVSFLVVMPTVNSVRVVYWHGPGFSS